ncbi:hypothetical protein BDQ12DRAFT_670705 [Crucibulum laeve]|uniref:Cupredoxin n=1 Tax=Crucibulum laeve TaxID=68775 RepID=A0A5C3LK35_9AGAR|nr:hypothetical protein BDQ12DRAFT_670705 [Crucibulum laeve]
MLGFTSFLSLLALLSLATSTIAANISIIVANESSLDVAQHFFFPNNITANVGDVVTFEFHGLNDDPRHKKDGGIDSGFFEVDFNQTVFPRFSLTADTTDPLFFSSAADGFFSRCKTDTVFEINVPQDIFKQFKIAVAEADIPLFNIQSSSIASHTTSNTISTIDYYKLVTVTSTSTASAAAFTLPGTPLSAVSQLSAPTAGNIALGSSSNGGMNVGVSATAIIAVVVSIFINL